MNRFCATTEDAYRRFVDNDTEIRAGRCPNGCGLLSAGQLPVVQQCEKCGFFCNVPRTGDAH